MDIVECVAFILIKKDKLLLEKRKETKVIEAGKITIPGGHVEAEETRLQTLNREIREELGIDRFDSRYICSLFNKTQEKQLVHYYLIENWLEEIECNEAQYIKWVSLKTHDSLERHSDKIALKLIDYFQNQPENILSIFDLDKTLISCDAITLWHQYLEKNQISLDKALLIKDAQFIRQYHQGKLDIATYYQFSIKQILHLHETELQQHIDMFIKEVLCQVFSKALEKINELSQLGHTLMVISASPFFIVEAICKQLKIKHVLATKFETNKGYFTGELKGLPVFKDGKIEALHLWSKENKQLFTSIHFYSDSINDLPLLKAVSQAYTVNACPQLQKEATKRNWPQLKWF
jgi:HAD superfamily hydrolase (TIGR01490 family)